MDENFAENIIESEDDGLDFDTIYNNIQTALKTKEVQAILRKIGLSEIDILKALDSDGLIEPSENDNEISFAQKFLKFMVYDKLLKNYKKARIPETPEDNIIQPNTQFTAEYKKANEMGDVDKMMGVISRYQLFPWISEEDKENVIPITMDALPEREFEKYVAKIESEFDRALDGVEFESYNVNQIQETEELTTEMSKPDIDPQSDTKRYMDKTDFSEEQDRRWFLNPTATIQEFHEHPNEPVANFLILCVGSRIETALEDLKQFKAKGFDVRTEINGTVLDTRECDTPEEIIELYNKKVDLDLQQMIDGKPKNDRDPEIQSKLSDLVTETILTSDGKPNPQIGDIGTVVENVIQNRQQEVGRATNPEANNQDKNANELLL